MLIVLAYLMNGNNFHVGNLFDMHKKMFNLQNTKIQNQLTTVFIAKKHVV